MTDEPLTSSDIQKPVILAVGTLWASPKIVWSAVWILKPSSKSKHRFVYMAGTFRYRRTEIVLLLRSEIFEDDFQGRLSLLS